MTLESKQLNTHIVEKIKYHKKLWNVALADEDYLSCAYHRDEVKRLKGMLQAVL